jgi:CheY-like chemotaxis protein
MSSDAPKPRMLLVNDEGYLLMTYELQLTPFFQIETAENGLQALQIVTTHAIDYFDVIVLDISMPIMDGMEACLRISNYIHGGQDSDSNHSLIRSRYNSESARLLRGISSPVNSSVNVNQDTVKKPIIYALTSESFPDALRKIAELPFEKIFGAIGPPEVEMIYKAINSRKS